MCITRYTTEPPTVLACIRSGRAGDVVLLGQAAWNHRHLDFAQTPMFGPVVGALVQYATSTILIPDAMREFAALIDASCWRADQLHGHAIVIFEAPDGWSAREIAGIVALAVSRGWQPVEELPVDGVSPFCPSHPANDEYCRSVVEIDLIHPGHPGIIVGSAQRTGITAPGFSKRAVYALQAGWFLGGPRRVPGLYVYDAGCFIESSTWHKRQKVMTETMNTPTSRPTQWTIVKAAAGGRTIYRPGQLLQLARWRKARQIRVGFAGGDLFSPEIPDTTIGEVWQAMADATSHTFFVLTKHPKRADTWLRNTAQSYQRWPVPNIALGVDVADQAAARRHIPPLLLCPAALHFVRCRLRGRVSLQTWLIRHCQKHGRPATECCRQYTTTNRLDWVLLEGEVGAGAWPLFPGWAQDLRDQAQKAGVAFMFSGYGAWRPVAMPHAEFTGERCIMDSSGQMQPASWNDVVNLTGDDYWAFERAGAAATCTLLDGVAWQQLPTFPEAVG